MWPFPLERIEQKDVYGCTIACVAIVCGVTYHRARNEFFPRHVKRVRDGKELMLSAHDIMPVIRRIGYSCVAKNTFKIYKKPSIVFFDWRAGGTHAVVWDPERECFLDPGYDWPLPEKVYMNNWHASKFASVIVTGKRR